MNSTELKFGIQSDLSVFADTLVEMTWEEVKASGERVLYFQLQLLRLMGLIWI